MTIRAIVPFSDNCQVCGKEFQDKEIIYNQRYYKVVGSKKKCVNTLTICEKCKNTKGEGNGT